MVTFSISKSDHRHVHLGPLVPPNRSRGMSKPWFFQAQWGVFLQEATAGASYMYQGSVPVPALALPWVPGAAGLREINDGEM